MDFKSKTTIAIHVVIILILICMKFTLESHEDRIHNLEQQIEFMQDDVISSLDEIHELVIKRNNNL